MVPVVDYGVLGGRHHPSRRRFRLRACADTVAGWWSVREHDLQLGIRNLTESGTNDLSHTYHLRYCRCSARTPDLASDAAAATRGAIDVPDPKEALMTRHRDELSDGLPPWAVATPTGLVPPSPPRPAAGSVAGTSPPAVTQRAYPTWSTGEREAGAPLRGSATPSPPAVARTGPVRAGCSPTSCLPGHTSARRARGRTAQRPAPVPAPNATWGPSPIRVSRRARHRGRYLSGGRDQVGHCGMGLLRAPRSCAPPRTRHETRPPSWP